MRMKLMFAAFISVRSWQPIGRCGCAANGGIFIVAIHPAQFDCLSIHAEDAACRGDLANPDRPHSCVGRCTILHKLCAKRIEIGVSAVQ